MTNQGERVQEKSEKKTPPLQEELNLDDDIKDASLTEHQTVLFKACFDQHEPEEVEAPPGATRVLTAILPSFPWPSGLSGPTFHCMRWKAGRPQGDHSQLVRIHGNRSLFTVLQEAFPELPSSAAFTIQGTDLLGTVFLKDFINGQAESDVPAFMLYGSQEVLGLDAMLDGSVASYGLINVLFSETVASLDDLATCWRATLRADCRGRELVEGEVSRVLLERMRDTAPRAGEGRVVCVYCGHLFHESMSDNNIIRHISLNHLDNTNKADKKNEKGRRKRREQNIICPICFNRIFDLKRHMKDKHDVKQELLQCPLCEKKVPIVSVHWKRIHSGQNVQCAKCPEFLNDYPKYSYHMRKHQGKEKTPGFCESCQVSYNNAYSHRRYKHRETQVYCDLHCGKKFSSKQGLKEHLNSVNGTWKKQQCPKCENYYVHLRDHLKYFHGKAKKNRSKLSKQIKCEPRICNCCGMKFRFSRELTVHIKQEHLPNLCKELQIKHSVDTKDGQQREDIANIFVQKKSTQVENNKIQCELCMKKCKTRSFMIAHMKNHFGFVFEKGVRYSEENSKVCQTCGLAVKGWQNRRDHVRKCGLKQVPKSTLASTSTMVHSHLSSSTTSSTVPLPHTTSSMTCPPPPLVERARCPDCGEVVAREEQGRHASLCTRLLG